MSRIMPVTRTEPNATAAVRAALREVGAPLLATQQGRRKKPLSLEELIAEALRSSHRDASLARVLPLVLWQHLESLDLATLVRLARARKELHTLGFFLDLTAELSRNRALRREARSLRDRRRKRPRLFFVHSEPGKFTLQLVEKNTPAIARYWQFLLNMPLDSFSSLFEKFKDRHAPLSTH